MTEFRTSVLSNGLRIVAEIYPQGYTAAFGYFVRAGSRDELDSESGLSHFLEHMVFKGTAKRSAVEVNRELDALGGQSNAYTTEEQTVYYATVIPKYQRKIVDLLTDLMRPALRDEDFQTERLVILEEIAKYDDQPPFGAFERLMEARFGPRGLGRRVLGTVDSIKAMQPETMRAYFDQRYQPGNMVLAATGNVDFDAMVSQVEELTADWSCNEVPKGLRFPSSLEINGVGQGNQQAREAAHAVQAYAVRIANAPSDNDLDRYPMRLLGAVLGDEAGSRLFWELVDSGKAEMAATWVQEFIDAGALFTYIACAPEDLEDTMNRTDRIIGEMIQKGIQKDELSQVVNKITAALIMQSERPGNRLFPVGGQWLLHDQYVSLDDRMHQYQSVTLDQINALLERYDLRTLAEVHTAG